jgi:hypothetical protein
MEIDIDGRILEPLRLASQSHKRRDPWRQEHCSRP